MIRKDMLRDLADAYVRLHSWLPNVSRGASDSEVRTPSPTRTLPIRVDVHDLIVEIEEGTRDLASLVCNALGVEVEREQNRSPVSDAIHTLDRHVDTLARTMPAMYGVVFDRLADMLGRARCAVGDVDAPESMATSCPECDEYTLFRVPTLDAVIVSCANPACVDDDGLMRTWDHIEWRQAVGLH